MKRLDARLRPAEDQCVVVVGALVGVDGLEVLGVAHDVVFGLDAVAAVHAARLAATCVKDLILEAAGARDARAYSPAGARSRAQKPNHVIAKPAMGL